MALEPVTFDELNTLKGSDIATTLQAQIDEMKSLKDFQRDEKVASFTSTGTGYNNIGLINTFTVGATTDVVSINFMGTGGFSSTQNGMVAYQIDSGTQVDVLQLGGSAGRLNCCFVADLTGLSAGTHTVKIYIKTGSGTMTIFYHDVGTEAAVLSTKVFG